VCVCVCMYVCVCLFMCVYAYLCKCVYMRPYMCVRICVSCLCICVHACMCIYVCLCIEYSEIYSTLDSALVASLQPNSGPLSGGTEVTVLGSGFLNAQGVCASPTFRVVSAFASAYASFCHSFTLNTKASLV